MTEESFMLVSLKEDKAKKLAQVISNETCRKILDFLSKGETTESDLSKQLNIPISTVHYNLHHLVENKLVIAEEFHYSQKGKEILHYKLANKLIIIAPADANPSLIEKLKSFLPIGVIILTATFTIGLVSKFFSKVSNSSGINSFKAAAMDSQARILPESANTLMASAPTEQLTTYQSFWSLINLNSMAIWFFIGAIFALTMYFVVERFKK